MNANLNTPPKDDKKSLCNRLTRTEIFLGITVLGLIVYLFHLSKQREIGEPTECTTPSCYNSIIEIKNYIDESVDPCEDFHEFVCGTFFENAYKFSVTADIIEQERQYNNELDAMTVQPISNKDSDAIKIQKMFFQACVDVENNDENHNQAILDMIDDVGGWPLQKKAKWVEKDFDWVELMMKCKNLGLPFQWFLEVNLHAEDVNYLKISHPVLDESTHGVMEQIISRVLGEKVNVKEIFDFAQRLNKILKQQKSETTLYTISELQALHPAFDWSNFINSVTESTFDEETQVACNVEKYLLDLHQLLQRTSKRTQANYIIWKIVEYFSPYLRINVRKLVTPRIQNTSRSQFCKESARKNFQYFTEIEYVRKYASEEAGNFVKELTDLVRNEVLKRVEETNWRNTSHGNKIVDILGSDINVDIGLDIVNADDEFLDDNFWHMGNVTFDSEHPNIIEIITKRSKSMYESLFANINKTAIKPEVINFLQTMYVNIVFDSSSNTLVVPPSMLHGFLYDNERPKYLNFASLGTSIAKELVKITQIVANRCVELDYRQILSEQTTFASLDVIREALPDIIARHIAYDVYQNWVTTNEEETQFPLLWYTPNQLFWIKSSLINCHKKLTGIQDESDFNLMVSKYKNILAVRQSRHFANDFSCSENTTMNPINKC